MAKWNGNKQLEKRLIELYGRGLGFGDIATQLSQEFEQEFSIKSIDSRIFVLREEGKLGSWIDNARIGTLDIETSNLDANAGFMVSWAIQDVETRERFADLITSEEITAEFGNDKRILLSLVETMKKFDVVLTFWGTGFDIPFMRARAVGQGVAFPEYGSIGHLDLFYACRSLFKLHRRSLQAATEFFGIDGKTHLDLRVWNKGRVGHKPSLSYILEHNIADVDILAKLWAVVKPYRKWIHKSI